MAETQDKPKAGKNPNRIIIINYVVFGLIFTFFIGIFSIIMAGVASFRNDITDYNYDQTSNIYSGPLTQSSPTLNRISESSDFYIQNKLTSESVKRYIDNTHLVATNGIVNIQADFVKKGLTLQPTYKTKFKATYTLSNSLDEISFVNFDFPFPFSSDNAEISNAKLLVNGVEVPNSKSSIKTTDTYGYTSTTQGLSWNGKIPAKSDVSIVVSYDTVGLSRFSYEGIENSKGAQDFNFEVTILGTRAYNVISGLSVDKREFGDNQVTLNWAKKDLYNAPLVNVSVGDKLNPSTQVSRIYLTMVPIYMVFMSIVLYLAYKFGKVLSIFDMFLITILFTIFFPFVHYLSSFTIDPTIDVFSSFNVGEYSMPLYLAFAIAWVVIGGLMYYLVGKISNFRFSTKLMLPVIVLFLGFFPLVVTIPEYSMLLVIIGAIALVAIMIQTRIKLMKNPI